MRLNKLANLIQLPSFESLIVGQPDGLQPIFAYHSLTLDVNVHSFIAIKAIEEKPARTEYTFHGRHLTEYHDDQPQIFVDNRRLKDKVCCEFARTMRSLICDYLAPICG